MSLFSQWLKPCGFSVFFWDKAGLSEAKQCRGILVQYDFIGQLYEILPTLYIVKAQAVISMQQFLSAQGYITEQVMAVGQLNPCVNHCPNT